MNFQIWSCNPADIPEWTEDEIARLNTALSGIFGWQKKTYMTEQERKTYQQLWADHYFRHQDGGLYRFKHFARYSDRSDQYCVVYEHVWPFSSEPWVRPIEEWVLTRFEPITAESATMLRMQPKEPAQAEISAKRAARKAAVSKETFNGESSI